MTFPLMDIVHIPCRMGVQQLHMHLIPCILMDIVHIPCFVGDIPSTSNINSTKSDSHSTPSTIGTMLRHVTRLVLEELKQILLGSLEFAKSVHLNT